MRHAELNHVLTFAVVSCLVVYMMINLLWGRALWAMAFNILYNVYPVMLQRYNRVRLMSLMEGMELHVSRKPTTS